MELKSFGGMAAILNNCVGMAMLWNDVVQEVMRRKADGKTSGLLSDNKKIITNKVKNSAIGGRNLAIYGLGAKYGDLYFTRRESECMLWLLRGKTINGVAIVLKLSPRTVEYYIKNMKNKLGCRTKFELIDLIYTSEFMKSVEGKVFI